MLEQLSDRPNIDCLQNFVNRALAENGDEIEFIVLFGSMAKGNWSHGSDYEKIASPLRDVLIGLRIDDNKRFIDRLYDYSLLSRGPIEAFVYSQSEIQLMFGQFHLTLLEALDHGIVLFDRGRWAKMQERFVLMLKKRVIEPVEHGWRISNHELESDLA